MKWILSFTTLSLILIAGNIFAQQTQSQPASAQVRTFPTAEKAAGALVTAAEKFDEAALNEIFGKDGIDVILTGEPPRDREIAKTFAELAHEKMTLAKDPKNKNHAIMVLGKEDWPFAIPIVKKNGQWFFDIVAGREELLYRRIGGNELDTIELCRGFVEAQHEYALEKHDGSSLNQYAQRIISTSGKQDGLAWKNPDGTWGGPIGENVAKAIESGYTNGLPYHGYYFKVLKGQGPAAPLGPMDFVIKGAMIGGFALVAAPAEYSVTGVKTFMVSHDGVVYEKDFGPDTPEEFKKMELFNPDETWNPVEEK